jgi:thiamine-phosphate pyrophosphorylase
VTDRSAARGDLVECVAAAVSAGVDWVQIRERNLEGAALLAFAEAISAGARSAAAKQARKVAIIVNRRVDVALALDADGVQLGFDAMDASSARKLLGPRAQIGVSTHSPDEIRDLPSEASYAQLAPIFPPLSKHHSGSCLGVEAISAAARYRISVPDPGGVTSDTSAALRSARAAGHGIPIIDQDGDMSDNPTVLNSARAAGHKIPIIAQGGVTSDNAAAMIAAGAAGVAVTGAILSAPDPAAATRALRAALVSNRL